MIEFIKDTKKEVVNVLTIHDVEENQFFIDEHGRLCQKIEDYSYNVIADSEGNPYSLADEVMYDGDIITKIIDRVAKIKFN